MKYKLKVNKLEISSEKIKINIKGEIYSLDIKSKCLSKPRVVLYFINNEEERRIPIPIKPENIFFTDGKCEFLAEYEYFIKEIFWKTRNKELPFEIYLNFQFKDVYKEKLDFGISSKKIKIDKKYYVAEHKKDRIYVSNICKEKKKFLLKTNIKEFWKEINMAVYFPKLIKYCIQQRTFPKSITRDEVLTALNINLTEYKSCLIKLYYKLNKFRKIKSNRITFYTTRTSGISGNFKFVYEKIKQDENLNINFWFGSKLVKDMSIQEIKMVAKLCATSKVIIIDEVTHPIYLIKLKKETKIIQLWHACGAFKTFGYSRIGKINAPLPFSDIHRTYNYAIVSSEHCRKYFSEGFGIPISNVITTGIPRTDIFFDEKYKENAKQTFYKKYPKFKNKKIILFAPTFRGNYTSVATYSMKMFSVREVCDYLGDEYAIIIKHHPFSRGKHYIPNKYADRVIDLTQSADINDLLFVADLVITDYSSVIFECALLNLPMIFYAYDLKRYIDNRDFYLDYENDIPGEICMDLKSVLETIRSGYEGSEKCNEFKNKFFDYLDGKSSERVANLIYKALKEK